MKRLRALLGVMALAALLPASSAHALGISVTASPSSVTMLSPVTITAAGDVGAVQYPARVTVYVVPASLGCAADSESTNNRLAAADTKAYWELRGREATGAFSHTWTLRPTLGGEFVVCGFAEADEAKLAAAPVALSVAPARAVFGPLAPAVTIDSKLYPRISLTLTGTTNVATPMKVEMVYVRPKEKPFPCSDLRGTALTASSATAGPGDFSVTFGGKLLPLPSGTRGPVTFKVCATAALPFQDVNPDEQVYLGQKWLDDTTLGTAETLFTLKRWGPPAKLLGAHVWHWTHPRITTIDITIRGEANDPHTFNGIKVNRRTRTFHGKLRFSDGSKGRIDGRFDRRWRTLTGTATYLGCKITFTKHAKFR